MLNSSISSTLKNKLVTDDLEDIHDEERVRQPCLYIFCNFIFNPFFFILAKDSSGIIQHEFLRITEAQGRNGL